METFSKAKDWVLTGLLLFIASMAWDIRTTVTKLDKESVSTAFEIRMLKDAGDKRDKKNNEQDVAIQRIEAILNKDNYEPKKELVHIGE